MTCQSRTWIVVGLAALMLVVPVNAFPHGCGLDDLGCHHNRKADAYHIQRGSFVRQQFRSKADALTSLRNANPMLASPPSAIAPISGKPRIIDGDTIEVAGQRIPSVVDAVEVCLGSRSVIRGARPGNRSWAAGHHGLASAQSGPIDASASPMSG